MAAGDVRENRTNLKRISELVDEIREAIDKERNKKRNTDEGTVEAASSSSTNEPKKGHFKRVTIKEKADRRTTP